MINILTEIKLMRNFDDKNFNKSKSINDSQNNLPQTSRYDCNMKEKYLAKLFQNIIYTNLNNIKANTHKNQNETITNRGESLRTIITHSKRNNSSTIYPALSRTIMTKDNKNNISTEFISNESMMNFEDQLNHLLTNHNPNQSKEDS